MGASSSTPAAPSVGESAAKPPSECPMHQKSPDVDTNQNQTAYPSECPMHAQAQTAKVNPENMVCILILFCTQLKSF